MTEKQEEVLIRSFAWISDSWRSGHTMTCRASPVLPPEQREPCNCGRDALLSDIRDVLEAKPVKTTNGSGKAHYE